MDIENAPNLLKNKEQGSVRLFLGPFSREVYINIETRHAILRPDLPKHAQEQLAFQSNVVQLHKGSFLLDRAAVD